jgi:hypothetical protein
MKDAPSTSQATCVKCNRPAIGGGDDPKVVYTGPVLDLCIRCLNKQVFQLWNESSSWSEIVALNHAFVSGKTWSSTTQGASLDPESAPLIPGLKRLHDYGIITTSSQPYSHGKRVTAEGETLEYKQRPFLEFTLPAMHPNVPKDKVHALIHALVAHDTVCASVWSNRDKYPIDAPGATDIQPLTDDDPLYAYRTSTTEIRCPCVTKVRKAQTQEELSTVPWNENCTVVRGGYQEFFIWGEEDPGRPGMSEIQAIFQAREGSPLYGLLEKMKTLTVEVWAREWDVDLDLPALVEKACMEAGLERVFKNEEE